MASGTKETYSSFGFRPPVPRSLRRFLISTTDAPPEGEAANDIRYGRIPQRVRRRYKALKCIWCVYYSTCLPIRLADLSAPMRLFKLFHSNIVPNSAVPTETA